MKAVTYRKPAIREWRKLPADVQARIEAALAAYARTGTGDVKTLKGRDGARLRIGNYRVIFVETAEVIEVFAIGHRKKIYR
jgi:mRNA interferase RelE/StbE